MKGACKKVADKDLDELSDSILLKYKKAMKSSKDEEMKEEDVSKLVSENEMLKTQVDLLRQEIRDRDELHGLVKKLRKYVYCLTPAADTGVAGVGDEKPTESKISKVYKGDIMKTPIIHEVIEPFLGESSQEKPSSGGEKQTKITSQINGEQPSIPSKQSQSDNMIVLGPGLVVKRDILTTLKKLKMSKYVADLMSSTLTREFMARHSLKGQKGKNGETKERLDPTYVSSLIAHVMEVTFAKEQRKVIEQDIKRAISQKLNNEEASFNITKKVVKAEASPPNTETGDSAGEGTSEGTSEEPQASVDDEAKDC